MKKRIEVLPGVFVLYIGKVKVKFKQPQIFGNISSVDHLTGFHSDGETLMFAGVVHKLHKIIHNNTTYYVTRHSLNGMAESFFLNLEKQGQCKIK